MNNRRSDMDAETKSDEPNTPHNSGGSSDETSSQTGSHTKENKDKEVDNIKDTWRPEHVVILSEWADKAMCYRWLHFRSYQIYHRKYIWFTIPVIIISTLTGTANFAAPSFNIPHSSAIIGIFNIIAGIISTIQQFLKINEKYEGHKIASTAWDKLYRNIRIELSKNPSERMSPKVMLKMYKDEYSRLMETCPEIDDKVIRQFKYEFKNKLSITDPKNPDVVIQIQQPEIIGDLKPTFSMIYKEDDKPPLTIEELPTPEIESKEDAMQKALAKIKQDNALNTMRENLLRKTTFNRNKKAVKEFIDEFEKTNDRKPDIKEVISSLEGKVDSDTIRKVLDNSLDE